MVKIPFINYTMAIDTSLEFVPINIAVLTISDTRTEETDTSGMPFLKSGSVKQDIIVSRKKLSLMI